MRFVEKSVSYNIDAMTYSISLKDYKKETKERISA